MKLITKLSKNAEDMLCRDIMIDNGCGQFTWVGEVYFKTVAAQIAASGDLLEACELALDEMPIGRGGYLTAAINKAKGVS